MITAHNPLYLLVLETFLDYRIARFPGVALHESTSIKPVTRNIHVQKHQARSMKLDFPRCRKGLLPVSS